MQKIALNRTELAQALGCTFVMVQELESKEVNPLPFFSLPGSSEHLYSVDAISRWCDRESFLQNAGT